MSSNSPDPALLKNPLHFCSLGFGSGLSPVAPGTVGTLAAVPLVFGLLHLDWPIQLLVLFICFIFGVYCTGMTGRALGVHDHGAIVWDEFVGFGVTLIAFEPVWTWILAGFVCFRFFDIIKPWPIRWLDQRLAGGAGVMLDDVLAGIFAWLVLKLLEYSEVFAQLS